MGVFVGFLKREGCLLRPPPGAIFITRVDKSFEQIILKNSLTRNNVNLGPRRLDGRPGIGIEKWFDEFEQRDKWKLW